MTARSNRILSGTSALRFVLFAKVVARSHRSLSVYKTQIWAVFAAQMYREEVRRNLEKKDVEQKGK
jgi:hypothetical protein